MTLRDWLVQLELAGGWELFLREDEPALVRYDEGVYERIQLEDTGLAVDPDRVRMRNIIADLEERELDTSLFTFTDSSLRWAYSVEVFSSMGRPTIAASRVPPSPPSLEDLGLSEPFQRFAAYRSGLVLVSGNRGSGRSCTAGALLQSVLSQRLAYVITLQDRIRFLYEGFASPVFQQELGTDFDSWETGFGLVNRRSPEVILVDEIYGKETAEAVLAWALEGKLVIATYLGGDVVTALERLVDMFPIAERPRRSEELSLVLRACSAQRLVPGLDGGRHVALEFLQSTPDSVPLVAGRQWDILRDRLALAKDAERLSFGSSLARLVKEQQISREIGLAQAPREDEFLRALEGRPNRSAAYPWNLRLLLQMARETAASDIHLSVKRPPIFRVDGHLERLNLPVLDAAAIEKMLRSVMTSAQWAGLEKEREFDGSLALDDGTRFRLNVFFQKEFPAAALRLIPFRIPDAETLGIPEALLRLAFRPQGLLLLTGPTGSGKTTSVACLVDAINRGRACHIITVEDPIEYYHESHSSTIDQRQVESDTLSFKSALKFALRQDPDVLIVGEMRDTETIASALTAAETGHLVLATLHTNDACQTVDRIVDVFPPHQQSQIRQQVAASLLAVVSQRLLPRSDGNGRIAAFELMIATPAIRNLIREAKTHQIPNVISTSTSSGMRTLEKSLTELYRAGLVSYEEAARYFTEKSTPTEAPR
jgi:twitching motility protein PilT